VHVQTARGLRACTSRPHRNDQRGLRR
jgi:hypothetical protein